MLYVADERRLWREGSGEGCGPSRARMGPFDGDGVVGSVVSLPFEGPRIRKFLRLLAGRRLKACIARQVGR